LSRIERAEALVDFRAQGAQLFDVREQCPPDLFLILGGQAFHFGYGFFKCFDHETSIANYPSLLYRAASFTFAAEDILESGAPSTALRAVPLPRYRGGG